MKYIKIPSSDAASAIPRLMDTGIVDRSAKIRKDAEYRYVPVLDGFAGSAYDTVECSAYPRETKSPQERITEKLSFVPPDILKKMPMKWEYVGDIVILKADIPDEFKEHAGKAYAEVLGAKTVCVDRGVSGEFRRPGMEVIYGSDTISTKTENGIRYRFDVTKVMYSSGNTDERERMKRLDCGGETVVDMFAGIGYFTLPIAKFAKPKKVIACEKNPVSFAFLKENAETNGVSDIVEPILGDNRDIPGRSFADRIVMGYVQSTSWFLPKALDLVKEGGIIHYHDTFRVNEYKERIDAIFSELCVHEILRIREVKSFAPNISHYVADVRITGK